MRSALPAYVNLIERGNGYFTHWQFCIEYVQLEEVLLMEKPFQ